jgi:hypothetical protein
MRMGDSKRTASVSRPSAAEPEVEAQETLALLEILALGQDQVARGEVVRLSKVVERIRRRHG